MLTNPVRPPTILISDDDPAVVGTLARMARRAGFDFLSDTTARKVFDLAVEHQPEVILLDVRQEIDGRDILARLKRDPRTQGIRVVMLTGVGDEYTRHLCLELGADDYEVKPVDGLFMERIARRAGVEPCRHRPA